MKQIKTIEPEISDYCCPLCNSPLMIEWGNGIRQGDKSYGGFLICRGTNCPTPETVKGHGMGRSETTILNNAYKIIMAKYTGERIDLTSQAEETELPVVAEELNEDAI